MKITIYNLMKKDKISEFWRWNFHWYKFDVNSTGHGRSFCLWVVFISFWFYNKK